MEEKLSREERFKRAKEAREKAKKENSYGDWGSTEVPEFECAVLKPNTGHIIRLVGNSLEMAEADSDPLLVERSLIKGDDGKFFSYIWSSDSDHPMRKFMRTILGKYKWDKENRSRIYDNAKIPVFQRWMTNGIEGNRYNQGAMPQKYILFNCITRGEGDTWCKDHKHTKLLCWDVTEKEVDGEKKSYPVYGVKISLYKEIFDKKCTELGLHFEDTDFVVRRYDQKTSPDGETYLSVYSPEEQSAIKRMGEKDGKNYLSYISTDDLTEEEKNYERYSFKDIPFVSAVTPTSVVLAKLGKYIKEVDAQFGTHHYDEFVEEKAKELEVLKAKKAESADSKEQETESKSVVVEKSVEAEEPKSEPVAYKSKPVAEESLPSEVEAPAEPKAEEKSVVKTKKVAVPQEFTITQELIDLFPALEEMSDEEKALIVGFNEETGELEYKAGIDMAECPTCGETIPDAWTICICGQRFQ